MSWQLTERERAALSAEMARIGAMGGKATAQNMTARARRERSLKAVKARAMKLAARVAAQEAMK